MRDLQHALRLRRTREERARANFTGSLRRFVTHELARGLQHRYDADVPRAARQRVRNGNDVHRLLRTHEAFQFYSALRVTAQDLVYQCVRTPIERQRGALEALAAELAKSQPQTQLQLNPALPIPRSVSAIDIHLMPGSYTAADQANDLTAGAVYDNRLQVTSMGLMGDNLDDIGYSVTRFLRARYPQFAPRHILDLGCTVGHNTGPWAAQFPNAEVHAIDVAAPCLRYAAARARAQSRRIYFKQMNATALDYPAGSFDVVFSSMFLHEVPAREIPQVLREAYRVLRPGGLMLHMELPPNSALAPFDAFYLDWDSFYNNEPYYQAYRNLDPRQLCAAAGFSPENYFEYAIPSASATTSGVGAEIAVSTVIDASVGKLATGVRWYVFGAWR